MTPGVAVCTGSRPSGVNAAGCRVYGLDQSLRRIGNHQAKVIAQAGIGALGMSVPPTKAMAAGYWLNVRSDPWPGNIQGRTLEKEIS